MITLADKNNGSMTISKRVKTKAAMWVNDRKAAGDDNIPSVANLTNRLLIEFLNQQGYGDELEDIERSLKRAAVKTATSVKGAASRTASHNN